MATIDSALSEFMKLDFNTREMLLDIIMKRQTEARRQAIARNAQASLHEYRAGKLKKNSATELISRLEQM